MLKRFVSLLCVFQLLITLPKSAETGTPVRRDRYLDDSSTKSIEFCRFKDKLSELFLKYDSLFDGSQGSPELKNTTQMVIKSPQLIIAKPSQDRCYFTNDVDSLYGLPLSQDYVTDILSHLPPDACLLPDEQVLQDETNFEDFF